jgi:hypothetical protein
MVDLCNEARLIASRLLEQEGEFDMMRVFEVALSECLKRDNINKDDLATVWAMLQLGSRAIRKFSLSTEHYNFGPRFDPLPRVMDPGEDHSSS